MSKVDKMLLDAAGLNISQAADILSKSRQTISRGIASRGGRYFRTHEIYKLIQHVEAENKDLLPLVQRFIEDNYADHKDLIANTKLGADSILKFLNSDSAWSFMPNVKDLKFEFPHYYEELVLFLSKFGAGKEFHVVLETKNSVSEFKRDMQVVKGSRRCDMFYYHYDKVRYHPITFIFAGPNIKKVFILGSSTLTEVSANQSNRILYSVRTEPVPWKPV